MGLSSLALCIIFIFHGKLCLIICWNYSHTHVSWAKFKVSGMGSMGMSEAGERWVNGNVSAPYSTGKLFIKHF